MGIGTIALAGGAATSVYIGSALALRQSHGRSTSAYTNHEIGTTMLLSLGGAAAGAATGAAIGFASLRFLGRPNPVQGALIGAGLVGLAALSYGAVSSLTN